MGQERGNAALGRRDEGRWEGERGEGRGAEREVSKLFGHGVSTRPCIQRSKNKCKVSKTMKPNAYSSLSGMSV